MIQRYVIRKKKHLALRLDKREVDGEINKQAESIVESLNRLINQLESIKNEEEPLLKSIKSDFSGNSKHLLVFPTKKTQKIRRFAHFPNSFGENAINEKGKAHGGVQYFFTGRQRQ